MDITPLIDPAQQVIQSYGPGRFRVNGIVYETPIIVLPQATQAWAVKGPAAALTADDFAMLAARAAEFDVIVLGTGARGERLSADVRRALKATGLNVESMDTGAACRTYNVLMAEGRRVGAALLAL